MRLQFGDFTFDGGGCQVLKNGDAVALSPKAFQLLALLLEERGHVISKKELLERLWPDTVVAEENLKARIREIRTALGDSGREGKWIRTARGFGYAFQGEVWDEDISRRTAAPQQMYWLHYGERGFAVGRGETYVGRDPRCGIWIDDASVSRRHARIVVSSERVTLEDLGSKNGTAVGTISILGTTELFDGDRIRIGSVKLTFRSAGVDQSTESSPNNS
ncbi:MAG TPA: FHA domain-containing protein [Thermoanaerobaculia bacterium]|nr:FHA domain-containing protein [Thermoanaerobaculia bacterium]